MGEFEDRLRDAFDGELARTPVPSNLRQRVILNAVGTPRQATRRFGSAASTRVFAFGGALAAVVAIAVVAGSVGVALGRNGRPVAQESPAPSQSPAQVAFGKLPPPNLNPPVGVGGPGGAPGAIPYFGPAQMTWAGELPQVPGSAPVVRFTTPGAAEADALAARFGAKLDPRSSGPQARNYSGPGGLQMGVQLEPAEPTFAVLKNALKASSAGPTEALARAAAADFLSRYGLTPSWPYAILTSSAASPQQAGPFGPPPGMPGFTITYQRLLPLGNGGFAPEVDVNGDPAGLQLMVDPSGQVYRASGPLPAAETSGRYPLRAAGSTINAALTSAPLVQESGPVPSVPLTRAQLVYTAVRSGSQTYLEPGYLFTGTFVRDGLQYEKRVLVPALAASVTTG
jgi:hypothetical protein